MTSRQTDRCVRRKLPGPIAGAFVPLIAMLATAVVPSGCGPEVDRVEEDIGKVQSALTYTFNPVEDAYVDSANPGTSYGSALTLQTSSTKRTYLKFRVNQALTNVQSAQLELYVEDGTNDGPPVRMGTTDAWSQGTIT